MRKLALLFPVVALALGSSVPGAPPGRDAAAIGQRVRELERAGTLSWTRIPWVGALAEARQLAAQESRPVFLFSQEGNMRNGRC
jgi:hypothetical protein